MVAVRAKLDAGAEPARIAREVLAELTARGLNPERSGGEVVVPAGESRALRGAMAAAGYARLPAPFGNGPLRFVGYGSATGEWTEARVRLRGAPPVALALLDRIGAPFRRRGLGVALLGPDGAGKSSLIAAVESQYATPVASIYMGLYQGEDTASPRPRRRLRVPGVGLLANLARQQGRWLRGAYHRVRGRLVIFDRYTYDALLPPDAPQSRLARLRRRLMARACPAPDVVVVLDAPAEVLFERKGEHSVELLARHRERFLQLHRELPGSIVVDTGGRPEESTRVLLEAIWRLQAARWR